MTIDEDDVADNLVPFERPLPQLALCELILKDDFSIEMTVFDAAGDAEGVFSFQLAGKQPENFDLSRLRAAWARWKDHSSFAA